MWVYLCFVGDGQVELELCWELVLRVQAVREIHPSDATVSVDLVLRKHRSDNDGAGVSKRSYMQN